MDTCTDLPKELTVHTCKAFWEVTAGLIPGEPDPAYTRRWALTGSEWESEQRLPLFIAAMSGAMEYGRTLMHPDRLNWVRIEWIFV